MKFSDESWNLSKFGSIRCVQFWIVYCYLSVVVGFPDHDVKLIWCQQRNAIVSLVAICAATIDFLCSYLTCCLASLFDGQAGCNLYNMFTVKNLCSFCKRRCPTELSS